MRAPRRSVFEHGIQDGEQFAHTRGEGDLRHFARRAQARIQGADDGIPQGDRSIPTLRLHLTLSPLLRQHTRAATAKRKRVRVAQINISFRFPSP